MLGTPVHAQHTIAWTQRSRFVAGVQVEDLARLSFKRQPLYVGVDNKQDAATREGLEQGYCVVPSAQRFLLLFTFLKKNASKKVGLLGLDYELLAYSAVNDEITDAAVSWVPVVISANDL